MSHSGRKQLKSVKMVLFLLLSINLLITVSAFQSRIPLLGLKNIQNRGSRISMFNSDLLINNVDMNDVLTTIPTIPTSMGLAVEGETGYSSLSLYFTLALYVLTLPGLYSLITRSVKTKLVQKTYDIPGPANPTSKSTRQNAAEIMAYFKAMNYEVASADETIIFKGILGKSKSQAYFLSFCTFMGLGSLALVLSVIFQDLGSKPYFLTLLSPYAGIYYWNNANREDEVKIKMETSDDEQITSIVAQGGKEDLERFSKALELPERGKVYVKGIFDAGSETDQYISVETQATTSQQQTSTTEEVVPTSFSSDTTAK